MSTTCNETQYDKYTSTSPVQVEGEKKNHNDMPGIKEFINTTVKYLTSPISITYST